MTLYSIYFVHTLIPHLLLPLLSMGLFLQMGAVFQPFLGRMGLLYTKVEYGQEVEHGSCPSRNFNLVRNMITIYFVILG